MKNRKGLSVLIYLVVLALLFLWMTGVFGNLNSGIAYSEVVSLFEREQVVGFTVEGQQIRLELRNPYNGKTELVSHLADPELFRQEMGTLLQEQSASGVLEYYDFIPEAEFTAYDLIIPLLLVGGTLLFIWFLRSF